MTNRTVHTVVDIKMTPVLQDGARQIKCGNTNVLVIKQTNYLFLELCTVGTMGE